MLRSRSPIDNDLFRHRIHFGLDTVSQVLDLVSLIDNEAFFLYWE